jgi:hydrogenase expression/formation protein HypE
MTADPDFALRCPTPIAPGERVVLGHGSGGTLGARLVRDVFLPAFTPAFGRAFGSGELSRLGDAAVVDVGGVRIAFSTDSFVVSPKFFPGSDIGTLAVNGTVNDVAMMGARPAFLSAAFILEEGLELEVLSSVVASMAGACERAAVALVAGDTKVVERGSGDGLFVTTAGIGAVPNGVEVGPERARPGDVVVVSGPIASHGVAVMSRRSGIEFDGAIASDSAPLVDLVQAMLRAGDVHCLRDATRGGVATVLNELAEASGVAIELDERSVPVLDPVRAACEMLGLDPLYVANEGVAVAIVGTDDADAVVDAAHRVPEGAGARIVGTVTEGATRVTVRTGLGVTRPLIMLAGDQLPRIC